MPSGTLAKKEMISRISPISGISISPLMPWIMNPRSSVNRKPSWLSSLALVIVLPSSIQDESPNTAQAIAAAWSRIRASIA